MALFFPGLSDWPWEHCLGATCFRKPRCHPWESSWPCECCFQIPGPVAQLVDFHSKCLWLILANVTCFVLSLYMLLWLQDSHHHCDAMSLPSCTHTVLTYYTYKRLKTENYLFLLTFLNLLTSKWLNFFNVRCLMASFQCLFYEDLRVAYFKHQQRRNYYLTCKLLRTTSLQFVGVGWYHNGFMNFSVSCNSRLQTMLSHTEQPLKCSNGFIFLFTESSYIHVWCFSVLLFSHKCFLNLGTFYWSMWKSSPRCYLI